MAKRTIIGLFLMLLVVIGSYFFYKKENSNTSFVAQPASGDKSSENNSNGEKGNLVELLATAGNSRVCTFENSTSGGTAKGVIYSGDWKLRGDFSVTMEGSTIESHIIVLDNNSYIWKDGESKGIKSVFGEEDLELINDHSVENGQNDTDSGKSSKYDCSEWNVDNAFFELPKEIEFVAP